MARRKNIQSFRGGFFLSSVILQPAGSGAAKIHFIDTIRNTVELSIIEPFLSNGEYELVNTIYENGTIPIWGVTPGKTSANIKKWNRINTGDVTLFSGKGKIFATAVVTLKIHNPDLAIELWGRDDSGQTWEYIYFLDEVQEVSIPYLQFNKVVGYADNYIIQGFNLLDEEKSTKVLDFFDLESELYFPDTTKEDYEKAVKGLDPTKPLDKDTKVKARTEQYFLRNYLFKDKKKSVCGICGEEYPVNFLVAAHIKKRSQCSVEERLDHKHIVMPMCKFGCDDLYEKGFITVENGEIVDTHYGYRTPNLKDYIMKIENVSCSNWNSNTKKYFEWHNKSIK